MLTILVLIINRGKFEFAAILFVLGLVYFVCLTYSNITWYFETKSCTDLSITEQSLFMPFVFDNKQEEVPIKEIIYVKTEHRVPITKAKHIYIRLDGLELYVIRSWMKKEDYFKFYELLNERLEASRKDIQTK